MSSWMLLNNNTLIVNVLSLFLQKFERSSIFMFEIIPLPDVTEAIIAVTTVTSRVI